MIGNGGAPGTVKSGSGVVAVTHRSTSRENGCGGPTGNSTSNAGSYTRKSTVGKQTISSQAHHTPINAGSVSTNRVTQKVKASQLSASSLH